jgi:hypothetical protein
MTRLTTDTPWNGDNDMQANPATRTTRPILTKRSATYLVPTAVVSFWSIKYVIDLSLTHTTGPEIYGVLVAALSATAALISLAMHLSGRRRVLASVGVLVLWAVVALGGIAGTVAHVVGPVPGHGPVDLRPRPAPAPLVFTALGIVGGISLIRGQRHAATRDHES